MNEASVSSLTLCIVVDLSRVCHCRRHGRLLTQHIAMGDPGNSNTLHFHAPVPHRANIEKSGSSGKQAAKSPEGAGMEKVWK